MWIEIIARFHISNSLRGASRSLFKFLMRFSWCWDYRIFSTLRPDFFRNLWILDDVTIHPFYSSQTLKYLKINFQNLKKKNPEPESPKACSSPSSKKFTLNYTLQTISHNNRHINSIFKGKQPSPSGAVRFSLV